MRSKYEVKAQKELESDGWRVDNKAGMSRWSKNRDFWNLFDLVAIKYGEHVRWISIKGHIGGSVQTAHSQEIRDFYLPSCCTRELWVFPKTKKKQWRKYII